MVGLVFAALFGSILADADNATSTVAPTTESEPPECKGCNCPALRNKASLVHKYKGETNDRWLAEQTKIQTQELQVKAQRDQLNAVLAQARTPGYRAQLFNYSAELNRFSQELEDSKRRLEGFGEYMRQLDVYLIQLYDHYACAATITLEEHYSAPAPHALVESSGGEVPLQMPQGEGMQQTLDILKDGIKQATQAVVKDAKARGSVMKPPPPKTPNLLATLGGLGVEAPAQATAAAAPPLSISGLSGMPSVADVRKVLMDGFN